MRRIIIFISTFLISYTIVGQQISLIADANPGTDGSIRGQSVQFGNDIYYIGFKQGQFSHQLFHYDHSEGTVRSVTPAFNSSSNLLATTDEYLYVTDDNLMYRYDPNDKSLTEVADAGNKEFEVINSDKDIVVAGAYSFGDKTDVYAIKDSEPYVSKLNAEELDDEITIHIANLYISTKGVDPFGAPDIDRANLLFNRDTYQEVNPRDIVAGNFCQDGLLGVTTVSDFVFYSCDNQQSYVYNLNNSTTLPFSGAIRDAVLGEQYLYFTANEKFYIYELESYLLEGDSFLAGFGALGSDAGLGEPFYYTKNSAENVIYVEYFAFQLEVSVDGDIDSDFEVVNAVTVGDTDYILVQNGVREYSIIQFDRDATMTVFDEFANFEIGANFYPLFSIEDKLVFTYDDPDYGTELFQVDFVSDVKNEKLDGPIVVSPNPTTDIIEISSDYQYNSMELFDMAGHPIACDRASNHSLNIAHVPPGVYNLRCATKKGAVLTTKVVKL